MEIAIKTENLTKRFSSVTAVDGINLTVYKGEMFSVLGENGAGKSTTIGMLCGLIKPTDGKAEICGFDSEKERNEIKRILGLSPQESAVSANLTVKENLDLIASLYGFRGEEKEKRIKEITEEFKLGEVFDKRAKTLSGGFKRRLSIALALVPRPEIVFLDEPTLGLDVRARRDLWKEIEKLKGNTTVILTTHYIEEAENLCDRVAIMVKGKIRLCDTVENIKKAANADSLENAFLSLTEE